MRLEHGRIVCARPRGGDVFCIPGGKRERGESDMQTLLREVSEELAVALLPGTAPPVDQLLFDDLNAAGELR